VRGRIVRGYYVKELFGEELSGEALIREELTVILKKVTSMHIEKAMKQVSLLGQAGIKNDFFFNNSKKK
jgi:hypothetical protein